MADGTTMKTDSGSVEVYRDAGRRWRWRVKAENGRIVATSGEGDGYASIRDALRGLEAAGDVLGELFGGAPA